MRKIPPPSLPQAKENQTPDRAVSFAAIVTNWSLVITNFPPWLDYSTCVAISNFYPCQAASARRRSPGSGWQTAPLHVRRGRRRVLAYRVVVGDPAIFSESEPGRFDPARFESPAAVVRASAQGTSSAGWRRWWPCTTS
jgi:hypothetical protein